MKRPTISASVLAGIVLLAGLSVPTGAASGRPAADQRWGTVVNHGDPVPGSERTFNSYNPPSMSAAGDVAFRARSRGPHPRIAGVFLGRVGGSASSVADIRMQVPAPNTTGVKFVEFPSFPRIAIGTASVATRWNSAPTVQTPDGAFGHTGVVVSSGGALSTRLTQLGNLPGSEQDAVPGATLGTRFEVFPGAPAITDDGTVAFKGNYLDGGVERTGVFARSAGGGAPIHVIANSTTPIPGAPAGVTFGSTAPPSAAGTSMVFTGLDNEASPTRGGIYLAPIAPTPALIPLVTIGGPVPNVAGATFTRLGEGLSYDGRFVGFWGAWGNETRTVVLACPTEGNRDRIAYCRANFDNYPAQVPVHQGVFLADTATGALRLVAETGGPEGYGDFLYWNFSGAVPGENRPGESARWRSATFVAVGSRSGTTAWAAFKAQRGYIDGVYVAKQPGRAQITTLVDTTTPARSIDPEAPAGLFVTSLGIERDGLRGGKLAIAAGMGAEHGEESTWGGIYVTDLRGVGQVR